MQMTFGLKNIFLIWLTITIFSMSLLYLIFSANKRTQNSFKLLSTITYIFISYKYNLLGFKIILKIPNIWSSPWGRDLQADKTFKLLIGILFDSKQCFCLYNTQIARITFFTSLKSKPYVCLCLFWSPFYHNQPLRWLNNALWEFICCTLCLHAIIGANSLMHMNLTVDWGAKSLFIKLAPRNLYILGDAIYHQTIELEN